MRLHSSITTDRLLDAVERRETCLDNPGFCTACGADQDGCEPDARKYKCDVCGKRAVYGAEEILICIS